MLLVNGEVLDINGEKEIEKLVKKYKEELEEIGFPVSFKFPDKYFIRLRTGELQTPGTKSFTTRINTNTERGAEELVYCQRYWFDNDGNMLRHPNKIRINTTLTVEEKDWDLAVFLRYFYPHYGMNYELNNEKEKAKVKFDKESIETEVRTYIYSPASKKVSEEKYRQIALAMGVVNDNFMQLQNSLWDAVKEAEKKTKQGYQQFLDIVKKTSLLTVRSNVQKAIKANIIKKFPEQNQIWAYVDEGGTAGNMICRYKDPNDAVTDIVNHFNRVKKSYEEFLKLLGDDTA